MAHSLREFKGALSVLHVFASAGGTVEIDESGIRVFGSVRPADMPYHVHKALYDAGWVWEPTRNPDRAHWFLPPSPKP